MARACPGARRSPVAHRKLDAQAVPGSNHSLPRRRGLHAPSLGQRSFRRFSPPHGMNARLESLRSGPPRGRLDHQPWRSRSGIAWAANLGPWSLGVAIHLLQVLFPVIHQAALSRLSRWIARFNLPGPTLRHGGAYSRPQTEDMLIAVYATPPPSKGHTPGHESVRRTGHVLRRHGPSRCGTPRLRPWSPGWPKRTGSRASDNLFGPGRLEPALYKITSSGLRGRRRPSPRPTSFARPGLPRNTNRRAVRIQAPQYERLRTVTGRTEGLQAENAKEPRPSPAG